MNRPPLQSIFASIIALQVLGMLSSTGAFEVVVEDSGRVLWSKLAQGTYPQTAPFIAALPPRS